jgi:peptidoglycan/LPS O-acetylase OafA/YrhL
VTPRTVRIAGAIAALEGALALVAAVALVVREAGGHHEVAISGYGTAAWFAIMGSGVAAAGWALWTGRRWGRGIAVFANLVLLGVAWYVFSSGQLRYAMAVAATAIAALALLFSPSGLHWLTQEPDSAASSDKRGPDTR